MDIRNAITLSDSQNIAADLDDDELAKIATMVIETADRDYQTMIPWIECVEEGLKLCEPEYKPKSEPWDGASNYKASLLLEAANDFGNRFTMEVMRDDRLAKAEAIGAATIKNVIERKASQNSMLKAQIDPIAEQMAQLEQPDEQLVSQLQELQAAYQENDQKIKLKRQELRDRHHKCDRVTEAVNWEINHKMKSWREDHADMMYRLPLVGTMFKKTVYDQVRGCEASHLICFPDFIVNQRTISMGDCQSFTHIIAINKSTAEARMRDGIWLDVPLYAEDATGDEGSNEKSESEKTRENPDCFYEQYRWLDLDDDGIDEPYIVTLHCRSARVVRIVARYGLDTINVRGEDGRVLPLLKAQRERAAQIAKDIDEFGAEIPMPDPNDLTPYTLVSIDPYDILTKYGFMPSVNGTFLDIGFFHLIGPEVMGVNKASNDLMNAGTLANLQSGFTAKGFRKRAGPIKLKPGEFPQTEIPPEQMANSILPLPIKEPSATLYQLRQDMVANARGFMANADPAGMIQANTAPTTAMAIVQEAMMQHSAHVSRVIRSMSNEFRIIYRLMRDYLTDSDYQRMLGDDEVTVKDDFDLDNLTVVASANPEMSSRMQRMALATAEMEQVPMVIQAGGNPVPIIKNYYARIGSENTDEIFPNEAEMSPEEKAQMEAMRQQQEYANQLAQQQVQMITLQTELLKAREERADREMDVKLRDMMVAIDLKLEQVLKTKSETVLNLEKAETEQVKNQIDIYTTRSEELTRAEEALLQPEVE